MRIFDLKNGFLLNQRYVIASTLGRGGFGVVYKCRDIISNEYRAVKMNKDSDDTEAEFNVMNNLHLVCQVPQVHELFEFDGVKGIVMDLCHDDMATLIARNPSKRFSPKTALCVFYNLMKCVRLLHNSRVVHSDIKAQNVCLSTKYNDKEYPIKLVDFGLARSLNHEVEDETTDQFRLIKYATCSMQDGNLASRRDDLIMGLYTLFSMCAFEPFHQTNLNLHKEQKKQFEDGEWKIAMKGTEEIWLHNITKAVIEGTPSDANPNWKMVLDACKVALEDFDPAEYVLPVIIDLEKDVYTLV